MNTIQTTIPGLDQTVTDADIRLWLQTVPRIDPDGPRAASYIRYWNVASKISRAKAQGRWPPSGAWID